MVKELDIWSDYSHGWSLVTTYWWQYKLYNPMKYLYKTKITNKKIVEGVENVIAISSFTEVYFLLVFN